MIRNFDSTPGASKKFLNSRDYIKLSNVYEMTAMFLVMEKGSRILVNFTLEFGKPIICALE